MTLRSRLIDALRENGHMSLGELSDHLSWEIDVAFEQVVNAIEDGDVYDDPDGNIGLAKEDAA